MCGYTHPCMCVCMYVQARDSFLLFETRFLTACGAHSWLDWGPWVSSGIFPSSGITCPCLAFYIGAGDSSWEHHAYATSTLSTQPIAPTFGASAAQSRNGAPDSSPSLPKGEAAPSVSEDSSSPAKAARKPQTEHLQRKDSSPSFPSVPRCEDPPAVHKLDQNLQGRASPSYNQGNLCYPDQPQSWDAVQSH